MTSLHVRQVDAMAGYKASHRGALGMTFAFELLDVFVGQFCATFLDHRLRNRICSPCAVSRCWGDRAMKLWTKHRSTAGTSPPL